MKNRIISTFAKKIRSQRRIEKMEEKNMRIDELYRQLWDYHKGMSNEELEDWWSRYQCNGSWYDGEGWIGFCVCEDILKERGIDWGGQFRPHGDKGEG